MAKIDTKPIKASFPNLNAPKTHKEIKIVCIIKMSSFIIKFITYPIDIKKNKEHYNVLIPDEAQNIKAN